MIISSENYYKQKFEIYKDVFKQNKYALKWLTYDKIGHLQSNPLKDIEQLWNIIKCHPM